MRAIFRVDASVFMGHGHVMRCLALAHELSYRGIEVGFVCRNHQGHLGELILQKSYTLFLLPKSKNEVYSEINDSVLWLGAKWEQDAQETSDAINSEKVDFLIVDHYAIDFRWHQKLRPHVEKIMVIDDLANRQLECDFLLDQTIGRNEKDYHPWVGKSCTLFLGTQYALLRNEFGLVRYSAIENKQFKRINRILVTVGGTDAENISGIVLEKLIEADWVEHPVVDIVINEQSPHFEAISTQAKSSRLQINILSNVNNMSELMLASDLSIGAGGTTSWERCCLGLPSILIKTAENQELVINNLDKAGAIIAGIDKNDINQQLPELISQLIKQPGSLEHISKSAFQVTQGLGARKLLVELDPVVTRNGKFMSLQRATFADAKLMYQWQCHPLTRKYSHHSNMPDYNEHEKWLSGKLADAGCTIYMIAIEGEKVGVFRLDYDSVSNYTPCLLISIYLAPSAYQQGIGNSTLAWANYVYRDYDLKAEIFSDNIASIKLFTKAGFVADKTLGCYIRRKIV